VETEYETDWIIAETDDDNDWYPDQGI